MDSIHPQLAAAEGDGLAWGRDKAGLELPWEETEPRVGPTGVDTGAILHLAAGCFSICNGVGIDYDQGLTTTHEAPAIVMVRARGFTCGTQY